MAIVELGASGSALPYFERAAGLRPTGIALTQAARCLRDLGRLDEAERVYREAMTATGGGSGHALVGLIAVLCDLRRYEEALPLAKQAAIDYPDSAPAQSVAARCLDEFVEILESSGRASSGHVDVVRGQADALRLRARELEPEAAADALRRRRERTFPVHALYPQTLAAASGMHVDHACSGGDPNAGVGAVGTADEEPGRAKPGALRRLLRILMRWGSDA